MSFDLQRTADELEALQTLIASPGWALFVQQAQTAFGGHTITQAAERMRTNSNYTEIGAEIVKVTERCATAKELVDWPQYQMARLERKLASVQTPTGFPGAR